MNRLLRLNRFRRLDRAAPRAGVGLPADVAAILSLSPEVYPPLQYASLPDYGQILWQDAARTTPVTTVGDPIGSALNIGALGGYFEAAGSARPEWRGMDGARFDGVDNVLRLDAPTAVDTHTFVLFYSLDETLGAVNTSALDAFESNPITYLLSSTGAIRRYLPLASSATGALGSGDSRPTHSQARWYALQDSAGAAFDLTGGAEDGGTTSGDRRRAPDGMSVGGPRIGGAGDHAPITVRAVARYPRILTAGEKSSLPELL